MNRNDKNKKSIPLNLNNFLKGKQIDSANKISYRTAGMQNIGKVSCMRRVPAPKWVPSIKAESGLSENSVRLQLANQIQSGWPNSVNSTENSFGGDSTSLRNQALLNKDKNQWNKATHNNKPFFLMGQEFPSLPSDGSPVDILTESQDKDGNKIKADDLGKTKLDDLRTRDNTISASTLNRIDALSISKSSKGDIAATGWAAEDEEPNFDEKIIFSDDDDDRGDDDDDGSLNEVQNWHTDTEEVVNKVDNSRMIIANQLQHLQQQQQQMISAACYDPQLPVGADTSWFEHTSQYNHHQQFQQFHQMQVNLPNQFITNAQFSQNILANNRSSTSSVTNEDSSFYHNSVTEQRNARNLEYHIAIERARQKKMGGSGVTHNLDNIDQHQQQQQLYVVRSRHESMTNSDNNTIDNINTVEMGPPGGPPLMLHIHNSNRPHISPTAAAGHLTPIMRFTHPPPPLPPHNHQSPSSPFMLPLEHHITDPSLMEKWVEFLKLQQQQQTQHQQFISNESNSESNIIKEQQQQQQQSQYQGNQIVVKQVMSRPTTITTSTVDIIKTADNNMTTTTTVSSSQHHQQQQQQYNVKKEGEDQSKESLASSVHLQEQQQQQIQNMNKDGNNGRKTKSLYSTEEEGARNDNVKRPNRSKYGPIVKEYRPSNNKQHNYKSGEYIASQDNKDHRYRGDDDVAYEDYHLYQQHYDRQNREYNNKSRNPSHHKYYEDTSATMSYNNRDLSSTAASGGGAAASDYNYRSNSLKYKSNKINKDYSNRPQSHVQVDQTDRSANPAIKKSSSENQDLQSSEKDNLENIDKKPAHSSNKDTKRVTGKQVTGSYQNKRYDNYGSYKDRSQTDGGGRQEYSMGFAVNPKDSQRQNYYSSNSYNRRYYPSEYDMYYSYPPNNSNYDNNYYHHHQQQQHYNNQYNTDQDPSYQSSSSSSKRPPKSSTQQEQWRTKERSAVAGGKSSQIVNNSSAGNRRSDKQRQSSSMPKESSNDNDQDEWETASEGGSERSNNVHRDSYKSSSGRQHHGDQQLNKGEDGNKRSTNNENQRSSENNRYGSSNSCSGTWPSYPDDDESDGAPGSAGGGGGGVGGGAQTSNNNQSNSSLNKSSETNQNKNPDNKSSNDSSTSKECSNSNNNSYKEPTKPSRSSIDYVDMSKLSSVINVDKLPEVTEDEELLYENVEQFQEVLSKSAKKNRKLEEQRRLKEEIEQKRQEALRLKNKNNDFQRNIKKPLIVKKEHQQQKISENKAEINNNNRKMDNRTLTLATRDKDQVVNGGSGNFKKFECNKVSMQIGSWDNSLADDINSDKKAPPKPIGTPAVPTSSWNVKFKSNPQSNQNNLRGSVENVKENIKPSQMDVKNNIQSSKNVYHSSTEVVDPNYNSSVSTAFPYNNNSIFERSNEEKKPKDALEAKSSDSITIPDSITFEYEVKNSTNCDNKSQRNTLKVDQRTLQKNDQQSLNDKINSVKTIWDNQPLGVPIVTESEINRTTTVSTVDIDPSHTSTNNNNNHQEVIVDVVTPAAAAASLSITNVCKVKPQLQQDFVNKKDINNETMITSSPFTIRNSPGAFITQNQGNYLPYTTHRFPQELFPDNMHVSDALATLFSNNQSGMHINYNPHLLDSSLLRQNHHLSGQDHHHILSNKINYITSQSSFYQPQSAVTQKLFSNPPGQLTPMNMDISSSHGAAVPLQQLLLTRQNSLTTMMQPPNGMPIPFIQNGQQQHAQTPLFPTNPLLGHSNFSPQLNPFSQGHYSPGTFPSLHHNPQFQQNQQLFINQQQQQHHHQQMLQNQLTHHDSRLINSGQSGLYNSLLGTPDISTNTGVLHDYNNSGGQQQQKNNIIQHHNGGNVGGGGGGPTMSGPSTTAIMLPHNLNILMKPHLFANNNNSQYNNAYQTPMQSNNINLRNGYESYSNIKIATDLESYNKSSENNNSVDRNNFCIDNYKQQRDDYYIDSNDYENCDIINNESWANNLRQANNNTNNNGNQNHNNYLQALDFQSQRSPLQLHLDPNIVSNENAYRNFMNNHLSLSNSTNCTPTSHNRQKYQQQNQQLDNQSSYGHHHQVKQSPRGYDSVPFGNPAIKNEVIDNRKVFCKSACGSVDPSSESGDNFGKDNNNQSEKSFSTKTKQHATKQRSSFSDNYEDKSSQPWSVMEDDNDADNNAVVVDGAVIDDSVDSVPHSSRANIFDNQYGYDETQLSSQTAESLGQFDPLQLKEMINKLREGPVMTSSSLHRKTVVPSSLSRMVPQFQSMIRPHKSSYSNYGGTEGCVGMGFYSRNTNNHSNNNNNRALTPPASSSSHYNNHMRNNCRQQQQSKMMNNNNNNSRYQPPPLHHHHRTKSPTKCSSVIDVIADMNINNDDIKDNVNVTDRVKRSDNTLLCDNNNDDNDSNIDDNDSSVIVVETILDSRPIVL